MAIIDYLASIGKRDSEGSSRLSYSVQQMANGLFFNRSTKPIDPGRRTLGHRSSYRRSSQHLFREIDRLANRRPSLLTHAEGKAIK